MRKWEWWGYRHINGSLHVERYFGPADLDEADENPFVRDYAGPWEAKDRKVALAILKDCISIWDGKLCKPTGVNS